MKRAPEILLWLALVALGTWMRVDGLAAMPLYGDEHHGMDLSEEADHSERGPRERQDEDELTYGDLMGHYDGFGTHVPTLLLRRLCTDLLGDHVVALRLVALVPGLLALLLLWPLGRHLVGSPAALVATAALATSSSHVFYSRFARSYALAVLLALLLVDAVRRATSEGGNWRHWALVALWTGLLPWVHLTSLGLIGATALAACWLGVRNARSVRGLLGPVLGFGSGGLLCVLLYLPARERLFLYLNKIGDEADLASTALLDIPAVLFGSRPVGATLACAIPIAALLLAWRRRGAHGLLPLAAIAGAVLPPLIFRPNGMAYAYARYLFSALPFMLLALSWLVVEGVRGFRPATPRKEWVGVGAGLLLVAWVFWAGPRSPRHPSAGPFDNTYQSLYRLGVFEEPYARTPEFYRTLAEEPGDVKIIECPPLLSRVGLLYRNYYLQHGKPTEIGMAWNLRHFSLSGPYVDVMHPKLAKRTDATYVVYHINVSKEWKEYLAWAAKRAPDVEAGLIERHFSYNRLVRNVNMPRGVLGEEFYEDRHIRVWKLR